jgi:hypothetical protein
MKKPLPFRTTPAAPRPCTAFIYLWLALLLLAWRLPAAAQAPAWQSAQAVAVATSAIAGNNSAVASAASDAAGNVFLTGFFTNTVVLGTTTLTSAGSSDVFVAKFNPASNQFVWAVRAGGVGTEYATALAVSGPNVYVAGTFVSATVAFGATTLTNVGSSSSGLTDGFIAKLADAGPTGSFLWAQRSGGTDFDYTTALAVSGSSVYVAGSFSGSTAGFGATILTNADLRGGPDIFVAKLTDAGSTGSFVWAQRAGGAGYDEAYGLAVTAAGVYVAGHFDSPTADFGPMTLANANPTAGNSSDIFVAKLIDAGSTGSFLWAQRAGGTEQDRAHALAVSGSSVYVAGYFGGFTAGFGSATLASAGGTEAFVTKLTDMGNTGSFVWAQRAGGTDNESVNALAVSGPNVYVTGGFASATADFGPTTLTNPNAGYRYMFVAKLTDAGAAGGFAWAQLCGGTVYNVANALAVSSASVYVAGAIYYSTANFGTITLTNSSANRYGVGFLASLTDPTLTAITAGHSLAPAQLYPNPARYTVTLCLPAGTAPASLTLSDALGRTVRTFPAPARAEATLDLRGLPAGLYLLRGAGSAHRLVVE